MISYYHLLQEHDNVILIQIVTAFSCSVCGTVRVEPGGFECSLGDTKWLLTLLSQDMLPRTNQVTLIISGFSTTADVCYEDCSATMATTASASYTDASVEPHDVKKTVVISVVVPIASIIFVVLLSLFIFLIKKR